MPRQQAGRKLRWPVPRVVAAADDQRVVAAVERHTELLEDRLNAREIELVSPRGALGGTPVQRRSGHERTRPGLRRPRRPGHERAQ